MDGDSAGGIVDGERELEDLHQQRREYAGHGSDKEGFYWVSKGRTCTRGDETGQPAVGAEAGVGFAKAESRDGISRGQCARSREKRVDRRARNRAERSVQPEDRASGVPGQPDRKSTRLNSSRLGISYAVFC